MEGLSTTKASRSTDNQRFAFHVRGYPPGKSGVKICENPRENLGKISEKPREEWPRFRLYTAQINAVFSHAEIRR